MKENSGFSSCTLSYDMNTCFEKLSDEELMLFENNKLEVTYKKGEILCKQGAFASHITFICNGLVRLYLEDEVNTLTLQLIPSGGIIGLTSLTKNSNIFHYSAMAYQDTTAQHLDISMFHHLVQSNAAFATEITNVLCDSTLQTYGRFFSFMHKQSYGRMADTLMCLATRIFNSMEFDLPLSRKELADLTGLSQESVIRILKKFKDENLIEIEGKTYRINDGDKLNEISQHG
ncbi:MAG: Crp/Fnr family transcriptional regulator [Bacteroidales bacterium]|nr:Crp/Fnr family transcriptional regulator [Bacteroidales bacterium]